MNRALCIGINKYPEHPLYGCVSDACSMASFLVNHCGFAVNDVRMLCDERATTEAILGRLGWLLASLNAGDRVCLHYSGHGAQVASHSDSGEVDGLDEVIVPCDFDWTPEHMITDKQFARMFVDVPDGVEFIFISDSCYSGDLLKVPLGMIKKQPRFMPQPEDIAWGVASALSKGISFPRGMRSAVHNSNVALISGCAEDQTSADAFINGRYAGALTHYLLAELIQPSGLVQTLATTIVHVRSALEKAGYDQTPQLEGHQDIMNRGFLLLD
mgnify:CR=1 FL=1